MEVRELALKGVLELRPRVFGDERGYFFESYNEETFRTAGLDFSFVQDNQSFSVTGTIRGLHFQAPPYTQGKLVRVVRGKALDVVVDIRTSSPTFGQHISFELSENDPCLVYIPVGFAHGFSVLENCIFQYKCTNLYHKASEMGINPLDRKLDINWKVNNPIISEKDLSLPDFQHFKSPF